MGAIEGSNPTKSSVLLFFFDCLVYYYHYYLIDLVHSSDTWWLAFINQVSIRQDSETKRVLNI